MNAMNMKLTKSFFDDIRGLIVSARATVARGIDLVQVHTNFEIGRRIVLQEQKGQGRAVYGDEVIKALAERLTGEFGPGFSRSNLEYMRRFYLAYGNRTPNISQSATGKLAAGKKLQSATAKLGAPKNQSPSGRSEPPPFTLSWTHYVFLLGVKNPDERSFYEIEATSGNWTVRELKRQFDSSLFERLARGRALAGIRALPEEMKRLRNPDRYPVLLAPEMARVKARMLKKE